MFRPGDLAMLCGKCEIPIVIGEYSSSRIRSSGELVLVLRGEFYSFAPNFQEPWLQILTASGRIGWVPQRGWLKEP